MYPFYLCDARAKDRTFLYLNEFESRCNTLLEAIKEGILNHRLSEAPHELVHKIMVQKGELLQILSIKLQQGSTYKRITARAADGLVDKLMEAGHA